MNWKKVFSLILVLTIIFITPVTNAFAEEKDKKKEENPDEIIKHEDEDEAEKSVQNENIPDPPRDDSLIGDEEDVHEVEIETPSSVTGEKREGTGTVVDFSTTGSRAFYTIVDQDDNTFYLMIDMDKADNNVYFLSDVNKGQIGSNSGSNEDETTTGFFGNEESETENQVEQQAEEVDSKVKDEKEESSSNLGFLLVVVIVGLIGAFGYYFFVIKKKQNENLTDETSEDDEMLEVYEDEDLFADDSAEESETESDDK